MGFIQRLFRDAHKLGTVLLGMGFYVITCTIIKAISIYRYLSGLDEWGIAKKSLSDQKIQFLWVRRPYAVSKLL